MNKYSICRISAVPLFTCLILAAGAVQKQSPNLLFVFPDQLRAQSMGFVAEEKVRTPVIDSFAGESVYFSNAVSNYPVCSPTRAMLMSGQYPHHNMVISNCTNLTAGYECELPQEAVCWSDVLKTKGYSLGYIGKWHLDSPYEPFVNITTNGAPTTKPTRPLNTFVVNQPQGKEKTVMLFDRKNDPFQMNNIAADHPDLTRELSLELRKWLEKFNDPWISNPD